jgi:PAS domain S-box-containing protein
MLAILLGYDPSEIPPTHEGLARLHHPDDRAALARMQSIIAGPGSDDFFGESRIRTKAGEWRWIATAGRVTKRDAAGRALRAVGTHTDITPRKEAEEAVRRLNRELEERVAQRTAELAARVTEVELLNRELESFSYSVSHDLRAPLRNITGFLELLVRRVEGRLDSESERFVATVTVEAKRLGTLIDHLLAFSRIGRAELTRQRVDLASVIAEVREELRPDIGPRHLEWHVAPLPAVQGDPALLRQVIANLLNNAVKFTRHRDPAMIEIGVAPEAGDAAFATFFVRDNGAGFNPKYADKLFGVFQRLHNQRDFEGTGIGLANVKRIVERHGGQVRAKGEMDRGATFYFSLREWKGSSP